MQTLGNSRCFSFLYNEKQLDECNYRSESNGEATVYDFESGLRCFFLLELQVHIFFKIFLFFYAKNLVFSKII